MLPSVKLICKSLRNSIPDRTFIASGVTALSMLVAAGCNSKKNAAPALPQMHTRYQTVPLRQVPAVLKDTILERADLSNIEPYPVSGFGLVSGLHGTGDSFAGTAVREYMLKQMVVHGFGSRVLGMDKMQPEDILKDPTFAIVQVAGFIPPGARKHQRFDVYISAMDGNNTSSLARGHLYSTELKVNGANLQQPGYAIDTWAYGKGAVFVNPGYALRDPSTDSEARTNLRHGLVLGGGEVTMDRPLKLVLRQPSLALSRVTQSRINQAYQNLTTAAAKDEGSIYLYVPTQYGDDWEHFAQVAMHLFLNSTPEYSALKAQQLVDEAQKPDAPLLDISYCWEGFGRTVIPVIAPLLNSDKPEVAYAAARAAVHLGDSAAQGALIAMARDGTHPFQVPAVKTLGSLPSSPAINGMLRSLLSSTQTLVRIEAYKALAKNRDSFVNSVRIESPGGDGFTLDIVRAQGPALIYATRTGEPRLALIGDSMQVDLPVLFMAMDNRLSISSDEQRGLLKLFYRGPELPKPVSMDSSPKLDQLVARLAGAGAPGQARLQFGYCDVVSLLQAMADKKHVSAQVGDMRRAAAFVLQEAPQVQQAVEEATPIPEMPATQVPSTPQSGAAPIPEASAATGSRMNSGDVK